MNNISTPVAGINDSRDVQHMLRVLDGCLYCPAVAKVGSVLPEHTQLLCAVFALSLEAQFLGNSGKDAGKETASQHEVLFYRFAL